MREQDHQPYPDGSERRQRGNQDKDLFRHQIVKHHRHQQRHAHHHHRHPGYAVAGDPLEALRRQPLFRHAVHHAPGAKNIAVNRRDTGANHDDIQHGRRRRDPEAIEDQHKRTALLAKAVPREDRHQHRQGADVKQNNTQRNGVDGLWDDLLRVLRFRRGDADNFHAAESEHHDAKRGDDPLPAMWRKAAVAPQIFQPGGRETMAKAKEDDPRARRHHGDNRHHFNQRQPELHLAEHPHVAQVHRANKENDAEDPDPARHIGIPQSHIDTERGDVGQRHDHHFKGVGPAGNKSGQRPEILASIAAKGAGNRIAHRHFTQRAHHHKDRRAANQVGQQHRRTRRLNGGGRTIE